MPAFDLLGRPLRRLIRVAILTGVGDADACSQIGARHPEAVIPATVDAHVDPLGHVAVDAADRCVLVSVMGRHVEPVGQVATLADRVRLRRNL